MEFPVVNWNYKFYVAWESLESRIFLRFSSLFHPNHPRIYHLESWVLSFRPSVFNWLLGNFYYYYYKNNYDASDLINDKTKPNQTKQNRIRTWIALSLFYCYWKIQKDSSSSFPSSVQFSSAGWKAKTNHRKFGRVGCFVYKICNLQYRV